MMMMIVILVVIVVLLHLMMVTGMAICIYISVMYIKDLRYDMFYNSNPVSQESS